MPSWSEWLLVGVLALFLLSPKQWKQTLKTTARLYRKLKGAASRFADEVDKLTRF